MASVTSLGVHTPVALPYLINEGILPQGPTADQYRWEVYTWDNENGSGDDVEEELLATKDTVVWSQGRFIRNVYRFNQEGEDVFHALLTRFPAPSATRLQDQDRPFDRQSHKSPVDSFDRTADPPVSSIEAGATRTVGSLAKALVVILKTKIHVFYLQGSSHILDLPFDVETALPAPLGVLLQRRRTPVPQAPPTPQLPRVPANSFFSSQPRSSSSYLQSPSIAKSFAKAQNPVSRSLHGDARLDALFRDIVNSAERARDEDVASLYSLTDPLADFGVVTYSSQHQKAKSSGKQRLGLSVEFDGLDAAEEILYVSPKHELAPTSTAVGCERLVLLVTVNRELQIVSVWHGWYLEEKSLRTLLKLRAENKAAKARRRSSFLSANVATGTTTPAVRQRDGARESFAAPGTLRPHGDPGPPQPSAATSRKQTKEEEAQVMASQMDPDYQPAGSQQLGRENRRISSMNTDVRAGHGTVNANLAGAGGRRHTSFGGPAERRSLGHRRSRGSTPGSVFSRSVGPDDDQMDLDTTIEYEDYETIGNIVRHIRATFETSGIDNVFGSLEEGFKRELVVRKIHSFPTGPMAWAPGQAPQYYKVVTLPDSQFPRDKDESRLNMYIHRQDSKGLRCLSLRVFPCPLWPEIEMSPNIPIPIVGLDEKMGECEDIAKLNDRNTEALLLGGRGLIFALDNQKLCSLPATQPYRVYDPLDALIFQSEMDKDVGRNRVLQPEAGPKSLTRVGARGAFDEVADDGLCHRRALQLRPREDQVERVLDVFEVVLPLPNARAIRRYWCLARARLIDQHNLLNATACTPESVAAVSTMFVLVRELLDPKARADVNLFKLSSGKSQGESSTAAILRKRQRGRQLLSEPAWLSIDGKLPPPDPDPREERHVDHLLLVAASLADDISEAGEIHPEMTGDEIKIFAARLMFALHIIREDDKLCSLSLPPNDCQMLAPMTAQLGLLLGMSAWTPVHDNYYALEGATEDRWAYVKSNTANAPLDFLDQEPVGILGWFERALSGRPLDAFPTLSRIARFYAEDDISDAYRQYAIAKTPRIKLLQDLLDATDALTIEPVRIVEKMAELEVSASFLDSLPEAIAAPFREALSRCETSPPATWSQELLRLVGRDDLVMSTKRKTRQPSRSNPALQSGPRDILTICQALDQPAQNFKTKEASRNAISQLIFNKDRRLVEATSLMHFNSVQVAECPKLPEWTEAQHFDQQRRIMFFVTVRMIALPAGDGMLHYDSQTPLLTERYHLPGFNSTVLMQPMGHTLTADRTGLTEEKLSWAYFHAGVSAGLRIARSATGIDTSWIAFNKPNELTNRHAGLLLALGLSGHLRHVAKWLSFKYLTPKHAMTSIGLLLGLSASYLGTMDGLITRMLSVHITRMLPPGAAELNVSAVTQTAGLMGIGLLYYNTQHRRMSEVMLSEIEHMEVEDPDSGPDPLRDESYRLAAGFALGLINLAKGKDLRGLYGLHLPERLLAVAVGPRPVHAVHVFDRATAGAVIAIALVYMKTGDKAIASKIDIPDTEAQFDQVRPDVLMLRAMARHIIMWDDIRARKPGPNMQGWIDDHLPKCYKGRWRQVVEYQVSKRTIDSSHIPLFNVYTGLAWALGLRYAGSGNEHARDDILRLLDFFHSVSEGADAFYYDGKLGRAALRRCMDVLALSAASIMAGTGDIATFRYLRRMHGRTDADTPYGSHLAAHLSIGALFLGGGTLTFGTSPLALAGLTAAFYPLFPTDVHDNRVHLQAFRHFWVFAVEERCLIVEDIDSRRPVPMPLRVVLRTGETLNELVAPCLLPPLDAISSVQTADPGFWPVTLDFARNPAACERFRRDQKVFVRRRPAADAHASRFGALLTALEAVGGSVPRPREGPPWRAVLGLPGLGDLDLADVELVLPPDAMSSAYLDDRGTRVDDRVVLAKAAEGGSRDELWNLRALFAWAERQKEMGDGKLRWLGDEAVEKLKARVEARMREQAVAEEEEEEQL